MKVSVLIDRFVHFAGLRKIWAKFKVKVKNRSELPALSVTGFHFVSFFLCLVSKTWRWKVERKRCNEENMYPYQKSIHQEKSRWFPPNRKTRKIFHLNYVYILRENLKNRFLGGFNLPLGESWFSNWMCRWLTSKLWKNRSFMYKISLIWIYIEKFWVTSRCESIGSSFGYVIDEALIQVGCWFSDVTNMLLGIPGRNKNMNFQTFSLEYDTIGAICSTGQNPWEYLKNQILCKIHIKRVKK